jgi:hypothetical protein
VGDHIMERKLNQLFQQNNLSQVQIQEKFDPTPAAYNTSSQNTESSSDILEFINESKLKLNRLAQKMVHFEDRFDGLIQEVRASNAKLSSRFTERGLAENKVEALIERQNSIINTFEKRMNQMAKTFEDSQLQLLRTQSALEDARKEIAKLKKL